MIDLEDFYGSIDNIKQFFDDREATESKVGSVRNLLKYIGTELNTEHAERLNDISERVKASRIDGVSRNKKSKKQRLEDKILTEEEERRVMQVANEYETLVIKAMLDTGCRPGELAALRPKDINFDISKGDIEAAVKIDKNYVEGVGVQDSPKTEDSNRTVNLRSDTVELLKRFIDEEDIGEEELIFDSYREIFELTKEVFSLAWVKMEDGLTQFSPHYFRHNTCTRLTREGYDKRDVQQYMGHGSIEITEIYEHFNEDEVVEIYA